MLSPQAFPIATAVTLVVMTCVYLTVALLAYWVLGDQVLTPITSDLPASLPTPRFAANVLLLVHVAMAYVINANVLLRGAVRAAKGLIRLLSRSAEQVGYVATPTMHVLTSQELYLARNTQQDESPWWLWMAVSTVMMVAWVLCSLGIPGLQSLLALNGAACGICLMYVFPLAFSLRLLDSVLPSWQQKLNLALLMLAVTVGCFLTAAVVWGMLQ